MNIPYQQETESLHNDEQVLAEEIEDQNILSRVNGADGGKLIGGIIGGIGGAAGMATLASYKINSGAAATGATFGGLAVGGAAGVGAVAGTKAVIKGIGSQAARQSAKIIPMAPIPHV
jgi:hypothetical protein